MYTVSAIETVVVISCWHCVQLSTDVYTDMCGHAVQGLKPISYVYS